MERAQERAATPRRGRAALGEVLVAAVLAAGTGASMLALAWALRRSDSVRALSLPEYLLLAGALVLSTALGLAALARRARAFARGAGEPGVAAAWRLRAGAYLFAAGTALHLALFQPFKPLVLVLFWGAAAGSFALLDLCGERLARRVPPALLRALDRGLLGVLVLAAGLELGLRGLAHLSASPILARPDDPADMMRRHRYPPGTVFFGFPFDSRGYHDDEPLRGADGPLVVTVGDSFSIGVVPHCFHYTTVCEQQLGRGAIYNVGIPSTGPREYLRMLEADALPLEPDAVVVALFVGNDVVFPSYRGPLALLERAFSRESWMLYAVQRRLARLSRERARRTVESPLGRLPGMETGADVARGASPAELVARYPWLGDPALERPSFSPETFLETETGRALQLCRPGSPRAYAGLFAALRAMQAAAGDTPLFALLIPDEFQVEDPLWEDVVRRAERIGELDRDQPQRVVGAWLAEAGIPHLDLLPAFRAVPPGDEGRRHLYHLRDTHLNVRGNDVAGRALAGFLRRHVR